MNKKVHKRYTEKADLISHINISSLQEAEDILKAAGSEDLFEKAKHQDGDMHPNGKWVWVSSANGGKGDWRTKGGRTHTKHSANSNMEAKTDTAQSTNSKSTDEKTAPRSLDEYAAEKELKKRNGENQQVEKQKLKEQSTESEKTPKKEQNISNKKNKQENISDLVNSFSDIEGVDARSNAYRPYVFHKNWESVPYINIDVNGNKKQAEGIIKKINQKFNTSLNIDDFRQIRSPRLGYYYSIIFNPSDNKFYKTDKDLTDTLNKNKEKEILLDEKNKKKDKNNTKKEETDFTAAVNFLEKNADWWATYQYDTFDEDDEKEKEMKENFKSAEKFIKKFKTFTIGSEKDERRAEQYKKDMESKGFKLVDFGQGSGIVHYAILKNK